MIDRTRSLTGVALAKMLRGADRETTPSSPGAQEGAAKTSKSAGAASIANLDLSDAAKALLRRTSTDLDTTGLVAAPRDQLVRQTNELAAKLTDAFNGLKISQGNPITFKIDDAGAIKASGAEAGKIEKYFKDNPDVAEHFKALSAMHAMSAMQDIIRAHNAEKRAAGADKDRQAGAWDNYALRSMRVQSLSGAFQLKDGRLASATQDYAAGLASASASSTAKRQATDISV